MRAGPSDLAPVRRGGLTRALAASAGALRQSALWPVLRWIALLGLCAAYLQGGLQKAADFPAAMAEMAHFGLTPAGPFAAAVIVLEVGASLLVLAGRWRWAGALALAGFTLMATLLAARFWELEGAARFTAANTFFEHLGLVGGFLLVAWHDLDRRD